jgi:NADPH:quinone reductase-like Zn-dependent oxidoreductase
MKAIIYATQGGPEVLQYKDVPDPQIGPYEVLVRVRACALNHLDLWLRMGLPNLPVPLPHIPGSDVAGEVARVGDKVTNVKVGERILLQPGISCGQCASCLCGQDSMCPAYTLFGQGVDGGCAEFVKSPAVNCVPIPEKLSFEEAAAFPLVSLTAWHMLIGRAKLQPAETVLVLGAGARVIATAGSDAKLEKARELGADAVINHSTQKIADEVRRLTNRHGVEVVFEHVGQATWDNSIHSLAVGGRLVTCGATTGFDGAINIAYLFTRHLTILGSFMGSKAELFSALELLRRGLLKPVIDIVLPLEKCAEGHKRMENRELFGKIVLTVA